MNNYGEYYKINDTIYYEILELNNYSKGYYICIGYFTEKEFNIFINENKPKEIEPWYKKIF